MEPVAHIRIVDGRVENRLPPFGFEEKQILFVIEIDHGGRLVQIRDTRSPAGKKLVGRSFLVPQAVKRTVSVAANLLWDTAEYALGVDTRGKPERVAEQYAAFVARIEELEGRSRSTRCARVPQGCAERGGCEARAVERNLS